MLWTAGLVAAAVSVPSPAVNGRELVGGHVVPVQGPGRTILAEDGPVALVPLLVPLAAAVLLLVVTGRCRRADRVAQAAAAVVAVAALVAVLTVGPFLFPAAALVGAAAAGLSAGPAAPS